MDLRALAEQIKAWGRELGFQKVGIAAADLPLPPGPEWIESQWTRARNESDRGGRDTILVLDEIQKVRGWSETVKRLWDEDSAAFRPRDLSSLNPETDGSRSSARGALPVDSVPQNRMPSILTPAQQRLYRWLLALGAAMLLAVAAGLGALPRP